MSPELALWGSGDLPNPGDRLITAVVRDHLRRRLPDWRVTAFSPWARPDGPDGIEPLALDATGGWNGAERFDAVVVPGGGVLAGPPFRHPVLMLFSLGPDPAAFCPGTFTAWHAVGLQDGTPAPSSPAELAHLTALTERLDSCSVRDEPAAERLAARSGSRPPVVPDPVFALPPRPTSRGRGAPRRPRVAVALGSPRSAEQLAVRLGGVAGDARAPFSGELLVPADAARRDLVDDGADRRAGDTTLALLTGLLRLAEVADLVLVGVDDIYGDADFTRQLAALVTGAQCVLLSASDVSGLEAVLADCDLVLATRFHTLVLAMRSGRSVLAVETCGSPPSKISGLMASVGPAGAYWTPGGPPLEQAVAAALDRRDADAVADRYAAAHAGALAALDALTERLAEHVGAGTGVRR